MHIVGQDLSEFKTHWTALVPAPPFPVPHVAEQKIVMNLKLTIIRLEALGIYSPSQPNPFFDMAWGSQMAAPIAVAGINVTATPADPMPLKEDCRYGAQRYPVPLDALDVALRGQRLLGYGERLCRDEAGIAAAESGRDHPLPDHVTPAGPPDAGDSRTTTHVTHGCSSRRRLGNDAPEIAAD